MPVGNVAHRALRLLSECPILNKSTKHIPPLFYVFQTHIENDQVQITNLYEVRDEWNAQAEVDRINSNLDSAGIPSSVSCAYYQ